MRTLLCLAIVALIATSSCSSSDSDAEVPAEVEQVILCAGQEPRRELQPELVKAGVSVQCIGGADVAVELDAKRAIHQGFMVAATLD